MSNTPTESEFQIRDILFQLWRCGRDGIDIYGSTYNAEEAIKQAVDKHVIGEDVIFEFKPYTELNPDCESLGFLADFAGVMACNMCGVIKNDPDGHDCEYDNHRKQQQRKALYGGDKK
ncbi:hypothetical protein [Rhodococcus erythropolis]